MAARQASGQERAQVNPSCPSFITSLVHPSSMGWGSSGVRGSFAPWCRHQEDAAGIVRNLLQLLLESDKYAERKGAAYGLAGLVKGLGILSLKQQEIMSTLTEAIQDKKNFRQGGCNDCAKAVMRNWCPRALSYSRLYLLLHLIPPCSVDMLGRHGLSASPKQLSLLPARIVPKLTGCAHLLPRQVQKAGQQALRQIGSVIRNPEILGNEKFKRRGTEAGGQLITQCSAYQRSGKCSVIGLPHAQASKPAAPAIQPFLQINAKWWIHQWAPTPTSSDAQEKTDRDKDRGAVVEGGLIGTNMSPFGVSSDPVDRRGAGEKDKCFD
ncbi:unnamed protein product [Boreogadus saida]